MTPAQLEGQIQAPDFPKHLDWLNTGGKKLSLSDLKGKIVLLDFWTFCCINCMHIIPDLKKLEAKYPDELVVIGVHSAKFQNEKQSGQIRQAVLRYEIKHPVANDHDFEIWRAYAVSAWPTLVLINPGGRVIGIHSGEGIYDLFDHAIAKSVHYFEGKGELKRSRLNFPLEEASRPQTLLAFPGKISADEKGRRLLITDSNHNRILVADPQGQVLEVIGSGNAGAGDGSFAAAEFNHPQGTFLDAGILYIADTENHLIRAADLRTRTVKTILGTGAQASSPLDPGGRGTSVRLNSPWDLLVRGGRLYIAMAGAHQLWIADLKTLEAAPFAGSGREARIDGPLREAALAQPSGVTSDSRKIYFADSEVSSVRAADLDPNGRVETLIGEDLFEFGDIDGPASKARLQHALGVAYRDGKIYVADTYNSKIKVIDPEKKTSETFAGTGRPGFADGAKAAAEFNEPGGLAFLDKTLHVADTNNHLIRALDLETGAVSTLDLKRPEAANASGASGNLFGGRTVELPEQEIREGDGKLRLNFNLPEGYKFTQDAPFSLDWSSADPKVLRFAQDSKTLDAKKIIYPMEIPVTAGRGATEVSLHATIYYCTDKSTVCFFEGLSVHAPVKVLSQAPDVLNLQVDILDPKLQTHREKKS